MYVVNEISDNVTVINNNTNNTYSISTGVYPYGVAYNPVNKEMYVTNSGWYNVTVIPPAFSVIFKESSLSIGSTWFVNLSNSMTSGPISKSSYTFYLSNNSYTYRIETNNKVYHANGGSFKVNGKSLQENISFSMVMYTVTFSESGIPSGTTWYINGTLDNQTTTSTMTFRLTNGTYTFTVTSLKLYYASSNNYTVTVKGKNITDTVTYLRYSYITGKISPNNATVRINSKAIVLSSTGYFNVTVTAGSYYVIISEKGYKTYYSNVTLKNGITKNVDINLTKMPSSQISSNDEVYAIVSTIGVLVVLGVGVAFMRRKK